MPETIEVWRYENEEGIGPYQTKWRKGNDLHKAHGWDDYTRPARYYALPYFEGELDDYKCGCPTRRDLMQWFWGWNAELQDAGFRVTLYRVSKALDSTRGKPQRFFRRSAVVEEPLRPGKGGKLCVCT